MKHLLTGIILCLLTVCSYSQELSHAKTSNYYYNRSKKEKKTAKILLLSGGTSVVLGIGLYAAALNDGHLTNASVFGGYMVVAGVLSSLVSVPFFISAGDNRHKAASLSLNLKVSPLSYQLKTIRQPVIVLRINL